MKIAIGSDRRGFDLKQELITYLKRKGVDVIDEGPFDSHIPVDYAIYGEKVARAITSKEVDFGLVMCATGIGIMITCNKIKGVRCGMGYSDRTAAQMREHIDANCIAFGAEEMDWNDIKRRVDIFLSTAFQGGYHCSRLQQLTDIENDKPIFQTPVLNTF